MRKVKESFDSLPLEKWKESSNKFSMKAPPYSIWKINSKVFCEEFCEKTEVTSWLGPESRKFSASFGISSAFYFVKIDIESNWDVENSFI